GILDAEKAAKGSSDNIIGGVSKGSGKSIVSPEMEKKILEGQRKLPNKNEVIGGHSPNINNSKSKYAVEVIEEYSDGTKKIGFYTQFNDGNLSTYKKSTIFPENWSDKQIIDNISSVGDTRPIGFRARDGATLHRDTINGVQVEVIKIGDDVVSGYPTGGGVTGILSGFEAIK
ncbi:EndoU domain-containing protein, partial [Aminipila sp.]|uniref:EndoU domain-containing protein n=1 Tax=Aminipila sp. TaxID=2060095 RepID=UPI0028A0C025